MLIEPSKMANVAAICTALGRLGFSVTAAAFITDQQQMETLEELEVLTDSEVENLCKVCHRPGGTIPNPNVGVAGQPNTIPNPGLEVSLCAENNLKLTCFYLRYKKRTSRIVTAAEIDLPVIHQFHEFRDWEKDHEDVDPPELN